MVKPSIQPVFIVSLPRSGSTLLQRVMSLHPSMDTASEPWFLLPLLSLLRERGVSSAYGHSLAFWGAQEFFRGLPEGSEAVRVAIRRLALDLYQRSADGHGARYFIDKTPRYYLIAQDLLWTFPECRIIVLLRNPVSVISSMVQSWTKSYWRPNQFNTDLTDGIDRLLALSETDDPRVRSLQYESLVRNPDEEVSTIIRWLGLPSIPGSLITKVPKLSGLLGDSTGQARYGSQISQASAVNLKAIDSPWRVRWCRNYLDRIGTDRLYRLGYDRLLLEEMLLESATRRSSIRRDLLPHLVEWPKAVARDQLWHDHSLMTSIRRMAGPTGSVVQRRDRAVRRRGARAG